MKNILVPLDGSPFAEHALPLAVSLARRARFELHLLHVHTPLLSVYTDFHFYDNTLEEQIQLRNKTYLESLRQKLAKAGGVSVAASIREGNVAEEIRTHVAAAGVDLVVSTTHARGPMGRFWLGSVADQLVSDLPVPVLLVHPRPEAPDFQREIVLKHILVPLDGSPLAEQILEPALNLGRLMDADYTLLRVVRAIMPYPYEIEGATMGQMAQNLMDQIDNVHEELKHEAHAYLEGAAKKMGGPGVRVKTQVAVADQPAAAIVQQAVAPVTDTVCLATHGRHGLSRLFLGSVADKVIRNCTVPVLVFRPK